LVAVGFAVPALRALAPLRHDPRTTAKKLSQGLEVDGAGKLALEYKALHFNSEMFERAKKSQRYMDFLNAQIWGRMGAAKLGFDVVAGDAKLAAGDYEFGVNMTPAEEFSVVFWKAQEKIAVPLTIERDQKPVPYLSVVLLATDDVDTFELEARCGPFRGTADVKVPYLSEDHDHPADGGAPAK
jgi:hypothetical protein